MKAVAKSLRVAVVAGLTGSPDFLSTGMGGDRGVGGEPRDNGWDNDSGPFDGARLW